MKRIKRFNTFSNYRKYLSSILKKGGEIASDIWSAAKIEGEETKIAFEILKRLTKGEEVSDKEKNFLKEQSKDIAKIIPLVIIQGIPIPIPITPLLIILGKKYGYDFLPKDRRDMLD